MRRMDDSVSDRTTFKGIVAGFTNLQLKLITRWSFIECSVASLSIW